MTTTIRMPRLLAAAAAAWLLVPGCGSDQAPEPSIPAVDPVALESSPDQEPPAARERPADEVCIEMATREDWAGALDPCTRAAKDHPDDPDIQRALERALAADDAEVD